MTEIKPVYENTWKAQYRRYLRSPEWRALKERVLRRDGYMCQCCLNAPAVEVHHESYAYMRDTPAYLLQSVCRPCHEMLTAIDKGEIPPSRYELVELNEELPY